MIIEIDATDHLSTQTKKKNRSTCKIANPQLPKKRRKVLLSITNAKEQEDIYSLLHHIDLAKELRRDTGHDRRSAKHDELLKLVEKASSSSLLLDDLQCAKIVLL